jgi:hypothetical protein
MEPTNILSNNSHQELMSGGDECDSLKEVPSLTSISDGAGDRTGRRGYSISAGEWLTIIILCYVNLINYMDRFTIAGKNFYFRCWLNTGYDLFRSRVVYPWLCVCWPFVYRNASWHTDMSWCDETLACVCRLTVLRVRMTGICLWTGKLCFCRESSLQGDG